MKFDAFWLLLGLFAGALLFKFLGVEFPWWVVFLPLELAVALFLICLFLFWVIGTDDGSA